MNPGSETTSPVAGTALLADLQIGQEETISRLLQFDEQAHALSTPTRRIAVPAEHELPSSTTTATPVPARFQIGRKNRTYTYRSRKAASQQEVSDLRLRRLANADRPDNPFEQHRTCCKKMKCFSHVDTVRSFHWYREIMAMSREAKKATLTSWYKTGLENFFFDGRKVCWRFLNTAFGFSNDLLAAVKNTAGARAAQTSFAQPRERFGATLRDSIISFLKITAHDVGDEMPHRSFINLPATSRKQVYEAYLIYFSSKDPLRFNRSPPKISYFYNVWKSSVSEVKAMKNIGFEKCAECVFYQEERTKNLLNPTVLRELKAASRKHYDAMAEERRGYEMRKLQARREPQHFLSLVIDGADQSSYGLPHFLQKRKEDKGHKLAVKLVGVIIHGVEPDLYLFTMTEGFETGANHIIETLHRTLEMKKRELTKLPNTLFIQADNCTRENKNRYLLSYLEMFVMKGVFVEVQLSCLEVGHTHTDIDQSFSCVHRRLDHNAALSLSQLHEQLRKSYTPRPHVEELDRIANFSGECVRSKILSKVSKFTEYRYFRLLRSSNQAENGLYKTKCSVKRHVSEEWIELPRANGRGFLLRAPDLSNFPPTTTRILPNVREVNNCLRAAEARIQNHVIMEELYELRDRVYTAQEYEGRWNLSSFELNGDYTPDSARSDIEQPLSNTEADHSGSVQNFRYEIGDFVAVKPEATYKTPFWVAEVVGFGNLNTEGYPTILEVRWYLPGAGNDPFKVAYKSGFIENGPWVGEIDVRTVMLRFSGLTSRNRLSRETAVKLSRGLGAAASLE